MLPEKEPPVNREVLLHLKIIESPDVDQCCKVLVYKIYFILQSIIPDVSHI